MITRQIRTVSLKVTPFDFSSLKDYCLSETFLSKVFSRHFVSAAWEPERTIAFSFHAYCRGGSCKHLLFNTVLLLPADSILMIPFRR